MRPDPNVFLWIGAAIADAVVVNPNGIKTLFANSLSRFPIKGSPVFINAPKSVSESPTTFEEILKLPQYHFLF